MDILYKRIRARREELKMSQEELAKKLGYKSRSSINKIELGENDLPQSKIMAFAKALGTTPSYLMGWQDEEYAAQAENNTPCRTYPIIGEVAAGFGAEAIEEETGDYEQIPLEWMRGYSPKDFFVLRVKGNSMYPRYMDGDRVLVLRTRSVDSGAVAVVIYDGDQGTLKKVVYNRNEGYIDLIPYNPEYSPKRIAGEDIGNLLICGEVKRLIRIVK